jgi:ribosomal protein L11 methyltransferase
MSGILYVVRLTVARMDSERVEAFLELAGVAMVIQEMVDLPDSVFEAYFQTIEESESNMAALRELLMDSAPDAIRSLAIHELKNEDWAEYWKQFFHAERVSERIIVRPSWERLPLQMGDVDVEIDPGMSFGTGQHPTTRACLAFLDRYSANTPGGSFADLGCGSGILMIAAVKLGFGPVVGLDNDPMAVQIALENCQKNSVEMAVSAVVGDVGVWPLGRRFDVICANILAPTLIDHAAVLTDGLAESPTARLFVAGILTSQWADVKRAYEKQGLVMESEIRHPDWTSGSFRR